MNNEKSADYLIKRVRKNDAGIIIAVEISKNHGLAAMENYIYKSVNDVVKLLNSKMRIITIYENPYGIFVAGSFIEVYNNQYIRSNANNKPKDNLDNLPKF